MSWNLTRMRASVRLKISLGGSGKDWGGNVSDYKKMITSGCLLVFSTYIVVKAVTRAVNCNQPSRIVRLWFDFLPQLGNVHVHRA